MIMWVQDDAGTLVNIDQSVVTYADEDYPNGVAVMMGMLGDSGNAEAAPLWVCKYLDEANRAINRLFAAICDDCRGFKR